jgi:hypothetical protein
MNERIFELAEQAHEETYRVMGSTCLQEAFDDFYTEKFAKLIVRECIGVVEGGRFLHDQAPTAIFAKECSTAIKRHFGVKND